jgi:hypothetical protein
LSLCYDYQKWTTITLACIALRLTIGLVGLVYGQLPPGMDTQKGMKMLKDTDTATRLIPELGDILTDCSNAMALGDTSIMVPCANIIGNYAEHLKQAQNESHTEIIAVKLFRGY